MGKGSSAFVLAKSQVMAKSASWRKRNPVNPANPVNPDSDKTRGRSLCSAIRQKDENLNLPLQAHEEGKGFIARDSRLFSVNLPLQAHKGEGDLSLAFRP